MTARYCVLAHPDGDMPSMPGIDLCPGHREELQQNLDDTDLLLHLIWDMTLPARDPSNRRGKPIDPAAPANLAAIAAVDFRTHPDRGDQLVSVVATIQRWAARIYAAHPLIAPARSTIGWGQQLIHDHLDWLCRTPHAVTFATDLHDTAHHLRTCAGEILQPIGRHRAPHPRHPERDCGGRLYPLDVSGFQLGVQCIDCGERYDGHQELRRLGLVLEHAEIP